jgi:hypothetical protein
MAKVVLFIAFLLAAQTASAQFIFPIDGTVRNDWFLINFMDHDTTVGNIRDFQCGGLTYDGNLGTDFFLRDFKQMDAGVYVLAAADGKVLLTHDDEFDRSKQSDTGGYGNYIKIVHGDSLIAYYACLRKKSFLVKTGDSVHQGDHIAFVGSSGKSSDPHLHFEVYKFGKLTDPCGKLCTGEPEIPALFTFSPPYDNDLSAIESATASGRFGLDSMREHPDQKIFTVRDSFITFWTHGLSAGEGNSLLTRWYAPSGALWSSHLDSMGDNFRYWYYNVSIDGPGKAASMPRGKWGVSIYIEDQFFDSASFEIRDLAVASEKSPEINIAPNPAHHFVNITGITPREVHLYDMLGKEIPISVSHQDVSKVEWGVIPEGIYILKFEDREGKIYIEKILIEN